MSKLRRSDTPSSMRRSAEPPALDLQMSQWLLEFSFFLQQSSGLAMVEMIEETVGNDMSQIGWHTIGYFAGWSKVQEFGC